MKLTGIVLMAANLAGLGSSVMKSVVRTVRRGYVIETTALAPPGALMGIQDLFVVKVRSRFNVFFSKIDY